MCYHLYCRLFLITISLFVSQITFVNSAAVLPYLANDTRVKFEPPVQNINSDGQIAANINSNPSSKESKHSNLEKSEDLLKKQNMDIPSKLKEPLHIDPGKEVKGIAKGDEQSQNKDNIIAVKSVNGRILVNKEELKRVAIVRDDRPVHPRLPGMNDDIGFKLPEQSPNGIVRNDNSLKVPLIPKVTKNRQLVPLSLHDLQPPDHLEAVRMEQDGHLNRDYKKEIFFGEHEEIEKANSEEAKNKLTNIFSLADRNSDGYIDKEELQVWIEKKVNEHFRMAQQDNERVFQLLDTDSDGFIGWEEFHLEFLIAKGHNEELARKHVADYDVIPLETEDKDRLIRFKFLWAEADDEPKDNKLTLSEFRCFRHPEQSTSMIARMIEDIIDNLDKNRDNIITEAEFIMLPPGHEDDILHDDDKTWTEERRNEFRNVIDKNRDGKVGREELKNYVDPQNPNHARIEADSLIHLGDDDKDGRLSLNEILDNMDVFLGSKMVDTGRSFHDEF